jgi:PST family polysaccharide transporter
VKLLKERILKIIGNSTISNILWLLFDKVFRLLIGLVVGAWVARYLGPGDLGKLNYVYAYITILLAVTTLGMDSFLVKELLVNPLEKDKVLGTAFVFRLISVFISSATFLLVFFCMHFTAEYYQLYLLLLLSLVLTPLDLIDIEYQSRLQSKRTVLAKNTAYFLGAICKVFLLISHKPLIFFAAVVGLESLVAYLILLLQYQLKGAGVRAWKVDFGLGAVLLKKGWPFILASVAVILYMRIDQIMLGNLLGNKAVGEFSAAVKITEIFLFIPLAVSSSYYSTLMESVNNNDTVGYHRKMQLLFNWMSLIAIVISAGITLFSGLIVSILYGSQYQETAGILSIHVWSLVAIFLGVVSSQYLVIENLQKYSLYRTVVGLVTNVVLNLVLIPYMGTKGAAIATLISYFVSGVFGNLFFSPTRIIFRYQVNSIVSLVSFKKDNYKFG